MSGSKPFYDPIRKEVHGAKQTGLIQDERGVGCYLFDVMKKWASENRVAQIVAETGYKDTYKSFLTRCIRTAIGMQQLGIQKGDIISICSQHHLNSFIPMVAGYMLGVITAPTDPTLSVDEMKHLLNLVKPKLIFTTQCCELLMRDSLMDVKFKHEVVFFGDDKGDIKLKEFRMFDWFLQAKPSSEGLFEPVKADGLSSTCVIMFSSGTTGLPKGICLTHSLVMQAISGMKNLQNPIKTFLGYASLYWVSAAIIGTSSVAIGSQRLLCGSFQPELLCDYAGTYQVDYIFLATVQAIKVIPYLNEKGNTIKYLMISGSKIAPCYLQQIRDGIPGAFIASVYGQTEIGYISQLTEKDHNYNKLEASGLPMPGLIIKIVDPDTEEPLPLNQVGEIRVKTKTGLNGYYEQDSTSVWDFEGYIKTGDLGYFDDDLCLFVTDRIKEMFKYMSWHIVPAELESVLQSHPAVSLAIVIGIPHPTDDNHALGIVTLKTGVMVNEEEILLFVNDRVSDRHKLRAGVVVLDEKELPIGPSGKINRRLVKKIIEKKFYGNNNL